MKQNTVKHLIQCQCILPQFRRQEEPLFHRFVVFSEVKDENVVEKMAQCNNCGVVHRVIDFCRSEIIEGYETASGVLTTDDIQAMLPQRLVGFVAKYKPEPHTWEEINYIVKNKVWGSKVLISSERIKDMCNGKWLIINGDDDFTVELFSERFLI